MTSTLSVGIETNCVAPLGIERASMRLYQLFGVDSLFAARSLPRASCRARCGSRS